MPLLKNHDKRQRAGGEIRTTNFPVKVHRRLRCDLLMAPRDRLRHPEMKLSARGTPKTVVPKTVAVDAECFNDQPPPATGELAGGTEM